jgi:hypothetical protein
MKKVLKQLCFIMFFIFLFAYVIYGTLIVFGNMDIQIPLSFFLKPILFCAFPALLFYFVFEKTRM